MNNNTDSCQQILFACTRLNPKEIDVLLVQQLMADVQDWQSLLSGLESNALAPLFYSHLNDLTVPLNVSTSLALKALALRHQAIAQARYQAIEELAKVFADASIAWVALKGLALAPSLYAQIGHRPMRDMDILVPKQDLSEIIKIMHALGYQLPAEQPSQYMRGTHQLPNAEKQVNGFTISIEIHHNAISQDANDSLNFDDVGVQTETVQWNDLLIPVLSKELMLHQLSRHLEALHPGGNLKLINALDVVGFAQKNVSNLDWQLVRKHYCHILNTLRCLDYIVPLSQELRAVVGLQQGSTQSQRPVKGVGEIMLPLSTIFSTNYSLTERVTLLLLPSDWWLHLYYSVKPNRSLLFVKLIRHPYKVCRWLLNRLFSRLLGG